MESEIENKTYCEKVLKFLCIGGEVEGIRFGAAPQMLISSSDKNIDTIKGQIYLNLASRWCVFTEMPRKFPNAEEEIIELSEEEELMELIKLRYKSIANIYLTDKGPNLVICFKDRQVLFLHGNHELYESWQLGVAFDKPGDFWDVIALPGGDITAFVPNRVKELFK